jgi:hypothetical protein
MILFEISKISRSTNGTCILKKALKVGELLEEMEVRCRFGVECTTECQNFGILGSEFVDLPDGCPVKMSLADILIMYGFIYLSIIIFCIY